MNGAPHDCVVMYLYVHARGDELLYPTSRVGVGADRLAARYLECALVQAASLRFHGIDCEVMLVTNMADRQPLGRRAARLVGLLERFEVRVLHARYTHRPPGPIGYFHASRYVLDAIETAVASSPSDRRLWFTDVDCVWVDPALAFAAAPDDGVVGCIHMGYNIDWDRTGKTRRGYEALKSDVSSEHPVPRWVGGELLAGSSQCILELVHVCEQLDGELEQLDCVLGTEEQLLTLADALARVRVRDLGEVAARIPTGPRHAGWHPPDPCALGLWHLPSEKGLGFRRAADALLRERTRALRRDLLTPELAMRRFNVLGGNWTARRMRDDGWLAVNRLREHALAGTRRARVRRAVRSAGPSPRR
jgi:hypothetical protein